MSLVQLNKGTLCSSTLKAQEKKVHSVLSILAPRLKYGPIFILESKARIKISFYFSILCSDIYMSGVNPSDTKITREMHKSDKKIIYLLG